MRKHIETILNDLESKNITGAEAFERIEKLHKADDASCFTRTFAADDPYVRDHLVSGNPVLLGVTHVSLAIEAYLRANSDRPSFEIHKILFKNPLTLNEGDYADVTVSLEDREQSTHFISRVKKNRAGEPVLSAEGEFIRSSVAAPARVEVEALLHSNGPVRSGSELYGMQKPREIVHGPSLHTIREFSVSGNEVVSRLELTSEILHSGYSYYLHPAFFDGAITSIGAIEDDRWKSRADIYIPFAIKELKVWEGINGACYSRARISKANDEVVMVDIDLIAADGTIAVELRGFACKRVRRSDVGNHGKTLIDHETAKGPMPSSAANAKNGLVFAVIRYLTDKIKPMADSAGAVDLRTNFMDMGVDSNELVQLAQNMEHELGIELYPTLFFEYQNIEELAGYFATEHTLHLKAFFDSAPGETMPSEVISDDASVGSPVPGESQKEKREEKNRQTVRPTHVSHETSDEDIAVIGMAGRFAGSPDLRAFWEAIRDGRDLITEIPPDHFDYHPWYDQERKKKDSIYCKWGSFIKGVDAFDAAYFKVSPDEAVYMDPQLRMLLEVLCHTADDAGYGGQIRNTRTGLFVGVCFHDYQMEMARIGVPLSPYEGMGNAATMLANRPSFFFNLSGPSLTIDTACSSSLVAMHYAMQALRRNECDMAFVGGVNLLLTPWHYRYFCGLGALSPTGRTHTFDSRADGYVPGEGIAAVLLKPLQKALRDGDHIHAVIKGSAVGHSGYTSMISAPSTRSQARVLVEAWENAGIDPATLGYVDAHGTGTRLGDPVEIDALSAALKKYSANHSFCAVGSTKAHIGHTEGAAGVAGIIKLILSLKHATIPAMPDFRELNSFIRLDNSPLYINKKTQPWVRGGSPRRGGVSSFGFGGANAHVVVEEFDPESHQGYVPRRTPLAPTVFKPGRFWHDSICAGKGEPQPRQSAQINERPAKEEGLQSGLSDAIAKYLKVSIAGKLALSEENVDTDIGFMDMGIDSILLVELLEKLCADAGIQLSPSVLFDYQNISGFSAFCAENYTREFARYFEERGQSNFDATPLTHEIAHDVPDAADVHPMPQNGTSAVEDIAVIGMACRFPGARNPRQFWDAIAHGTSAVTEIPHSRWDINSLYDPDPSNLDKTNCRRGGFLEDIDAFDPLFFSISGQEAELTDPQQRIFLEESWNAFEDAGLTLDTLAGSRCGVFVGVSPGDYLFLQHGYGTKKEPQSFWGNDTSVLAARVSYYFNLKGPGIAVNTACSSSLVAIAKACDSIRSGESDFALAGGVYISTTPYYYIVASNANMLSPGGACKTFDDGADGYVPGEGCGVFVLKALDKALRDNDHIYGVIKGIGVNQDGRTSGITAPSARSQAELEAQVYSRAGIHPEGIAYVETHGTGTKLGDPIEIEALSRSFGRFTKKKQFCAVGSVKTNIGHTAAAAGSAGLIKVLMALQHKQIPPSLNYTRPNEHINFLESPFYVNTRLRNWSLPGGDLRRAALSSFGFSGTNAHAVIEEAPAVTENASAHTAQWFCVPLSAKSKTALAARIKELSRWLREEGNDASLKDISYTLCVRRNHFSFRAALVVRDRTELLNALSRLNTGEQAPQCHLSDTSGGVQKVQARMRDDIRAIITNMSGDSNRDADDYGDRMERLAAAFAQGAAVEWALLYDGGQCRTIAMPTYPFERDRYWVENKKEGMPSGTDAIQSATKKATLQYYRYYWKEVPLAPVVNPTSQVVLIFGNRDQKALMSALSARQGVDCVMIYDAESFGYNDGTYCVNPLQAGDFHELYQHLSERGVRPSAAMCLWGLRHRLEHDDEINRCVEKAIANVIMPVVFVIQGAVKSGIDSLKNIFVLSAGDQSASDPLCDSLMGCARSLSAFAPNLAVSLLKLPFSEKEEYAADMLCYEIINHPYGEAEEICLGPRGRFVKKVSQTQLPAPASAPFKKDAVYLITGGAGGLGRIIATYLSSVYGARLVLVGRREPDAGIQAMLQGFSGNAIYRSGDVADRMRMSAIIDEAVTRFGGINGIIHAAGIVSSSMLPDKDTGSFIATVSPKIGGAIVLDELTAGMDLDFFCMFSSSSAVLGDFGQGDYALANRFLDSYAGYRERLRTSGSRKGVSVSINWPLWREGGMHYDRDAEYMYLAASGTAYLETSEGITALESIAGSGENHMMVFFGDEKHIHSFLGISDASVLAQGQSAAYVAQERLPELVRTVWSPEHGPLEDRIDSDMKQMISGILKLPPDRLDPRENLGSFGFDSLTLKSLAARIGQMYGIDVHPTRFFAHSSIEKFRRFLLNNHAAQVREYYAASPATQNDHDVDRIAAEKAMRKDSGVIASVADTVYHGNSSAVTTPVAIVGAAALFPGARDLDEFWENLVQGKDSVSEIPSSRWDWREWYGDSVKDKNKCNSKWGAFIDGVDRFDPRFFKISPREAEMMDPQHRLFLETVWKAIEDSGHRPSELAGKDVGVFAGIQFVEYQEMIGETGELSALMGTGNAHAMLTNRISFLLDLRGPSAPIDTACSSSLIAVHRAVKSIQRGECEMAVAGGVNLLLSPHAYVIASQVGMLSPDGKCKTFDASANGYVRGEGVGAVLLKPLDRAIADNDHIYAVIRGTAEKHGGRAASITAPNSEAQADLIVRAFSESGFAPESVSYIETHGTGTELGDPVEINGLISAFNALSPAGEKGRVKNNYCGIGSVKTNIGHLEPASGIAGLLKTVLALKNKKIPASLNLKTINPYISLEDTPFFIVDRAMDWERPRAENGFELPRRAGVSSFGFGGAYAHVVLEEYTGQATPSAKENAPALIVLSAKNSERLREYAANLLGYLEKRGADKKAPLADIAYTLQTGRDAMEERFTCIVSSHDELEQFLKEFIKTGRSAGIVCGNVKTASLDAGLILDGRAGREFLKIVVEERDYMKLARLWIAGVSIDWDALYGQQKPSRVSLPTYPFANERYWINPSRGSKMPVKKLHPLIDRLDHGLSMENGLVFVKTFDPENPIVRDHEIRGERMVPVPGFLEMAYAAAGRVIEGPLVLRNVMLLNPIVIESATSVLVSVGKKNGRHIFSIESMKGDVRTVYAQGSFAAALKDTRHEDPIPIDEIKSRCVNTIQREALHDGLVAFGTRYGSYFHGMTAVYSNADEALGRLELSENLWSELDRYTMHPVLVDGALQSILGLFVGADVRSMKVMLPYALEEVAVLRPLKRTGYAYVRAAGKDRYDVTITDDQGNPCVRLVRLAFMPLPEIHEEISEKGPSIAAHAVAAIESNITADCTPIKEGNIAGLQSAFTELERICRFALYASFREEGIFTASGERYNRDALMLRLCVGKRFYRLFDALLAMLERGGFVRIFGQEIEIIDPPDDPVIGKLMQDIGPVFADLMDRSPDVYHQLKLLQPCVANLFGVLREKISATSVMFPNSSMELIEGINRGNVIADYYNEIIAQGVRACVAELFKTRSEEGKTGPVRIIEIGAGTGGTTSRVLPAIAEYAVGLEYCYTDISAAFTLHAKREFSETYPFVQYKTLNIEKSICDQGFVPGQYDILIAANVLHATRDMKRTIRNIKVLLRKHGLMFVNELVEVQDFLTLTFGLLDGWWLFTDETLRLRGAPLLSLDTWTGLLVGEGFESVKAFGYAECGGNAIPQKVIVGESNGMVESAYLRKNSAPRVPAQKKHEDVSLRVIPDKAVRLPERKNNDDALGRIESMIVEALVEALGIGADEVAMDQQFSDFGVDSIIGMDFFNRVCEKIGIELGVTVLFDYSNVTDLARYILETYRETIHLDDDTMGEHENNGDHDGDGFTRSGDMPPDTIDDHELKCLFEQLERGEVDIDALDKYMEEHYG